MASKYLRNHSNILAAAGRETAFARRHIDINFISPRS